MFDSHGVLFVQRARLSPASVLLHVFTHHGVTYEVRYSQVDGESFAALFVAFSNHARHLQPFPGDILSGLSAAAIRAGYIGAAEWLVKTGRWPDAETRSFYATEGLKALAA